MTKNWVTAKLMKINFDREERYEKIIEKCKRIVNASRQFYLADGSGTCIEQPQSQFEATRGASLDIRKLSKGVQFEVCIKTLDDTGVCV